jgi:hypothetical protein
VNRSRGKSDVFFGGGWEQFMRMNMFINSDDFMNDCMENLTALGNKIEELIKGHIISQDLPWKPLSDITVAFKGHSDIYIETGDLYDNIRVETMLTGSKQMEMVVYPSGTNVHSGISYQVIANWLEYGLNAAHIPPRPLWRVVYEEMQSTPEFENMAATLLKTAMPGKM